LRIQLGSRSGDWVIIRFRLGHIHIYLHIILVNSTFDKANTQKATDESTKMAKTRRTPLPQKYPAKANASVNKMKGSATTSPHSPNESDESGKPAVPDEGEVKVEVEQNNKVEEILADDGTAGIQSIREAAAAVVALFGATRKKIGTKSIQEEDAGEETCPPPPVITRYFGYVYSNFSGTMLNMA
jgi:hypothetical protein